MRDFSVRLADTWGAAAALGRALDDDEWDLPSECPGWSVRDLFAHVAGTESALLGREAPPPTGAPGGHVRNALGEWNEPWVEERRGWSGAEVLAEFAAVTTERLEVLAALTDEQLAAPTPSPLGVMPYVDFLSVRVLDCWIHEQDARQATGRPWRLDGPAAAATLARLDALLPRAVGKRVAPPEGTTVTVEVVGPLARRVSVRIVGGRAVEVAVADADVVLTISAPTYVRLVAGRVAPPGLAPGAVMVEGDAALGAAVLANLDQIP